VIELREGDVSLRALTLDDLEVLWESRAVGGPQLLKPRAGARERLAERIGRSPEFADGRIDLAIEQRGLLVGLIEARQPREGLPPAVFEIGISLFRTHDRGRGVGTVAMRLFTSYLFDRQRAERVQASTSVENAAMRRVLEKLGFTHEGVMRAFMPGEDGRDDYALYGVTREEWTEPQTSR
jgi:RimJ/RimL family protein N-acetyltransferase